MTNEELVLLQEIREADRNLQWLAEHYDEVRQKAAGRYVAVWRQQLLAFDRDPARATEIAVRKGADVNEVLVHYIPAQGESWVL